MKKFANDENYRKVREHCHFAGKYTVATHSIYNLRFNVPNEVSVVFHNQSNYDYCFIKKGLANEFKGQFECFGEDTKKYKRNITKIDKDASETVITTSYKIEFLVSERYMIKFC